MSKIYRPYKNRYLISLYDEKDYLVGVFTCPCEFADLVADDDIIRRNRIRSNMLKAIERNSKFMWDGDKYKIYLVELNDKEIEEFSYEK